MLIGTHIELFEISVHEKSIQSNYATMFRSVASNLLTTLTISIFYPMVSPLALVFADLNH